MPEPMSNRPDAAAELADMRRKMIQQLTASGKLLQAVWTIDTDYFGSRFQHQLQQGAQVAFKEWDVATTVVETLAEELQGAAAFADSPVLRDCIASLVAGLEQLRTQVMELEKASLASVGLPSAKVQFNARVFPDNNPLACINEATGFVREVQGWITRTVDRIGALKMMLQEAERARQEAEETVTQVSTDEIAQTLGAEIKARDEDLSKLRAQAAQLQDKLARGGATAAAIEGGNDEEIRFLRAELARLADLNQSDRAEVRSLVVEIEGIAAQAEAEARPDGKDQTDDLVITLSVLRDAIADKGTIEAMATAADAVLVEWSKVVHRRAVLVAGELEQTKSFVSKHESAVKGATAEMEQLKLKLSAATGDAERSQAAFAKLQTELTQAKRGDSERLKAQDGDRQALAKQVAEVEARLAEAGKALDAERGKLKIIGGERDNTARELAAAKADLLGARSDAQKARADAEQARTALQQAKAEADKAKAEAQARMAEA
ncbi:MAG: hypothetical protein H0W72_06655, partial [Planctomycetes bacterium]|nr:hypothetical protein [Planctomycetota bacterium]